MPARNLVLNDGVLSAEVVSYEPVELAQLEAVVLIKGATVDEAQASVDAANQILADAQAALEDAKSEHQVGAGLVDSTTPPAESESPESASDGTDGTTENTAPELQV